MNITEVINQLTIKWGMSPAEINCGNCEEFAIAVIKQMGEGFEVWNDDVAHCYIVYKDKYYDAECPNGVSDYRQLPIFLTS